jgi:hypothetical protein
MSSEALPPKRKVAPQFDMQKTEQRDTTVIDEKLRTVWEALQAVAPKTEPTIDHYLTLDWALPYTELPQKARELIEMVVTHCDVSTLQVILQLARKRIVDDYQLWSLLKEVEETLQLGNEIYRKRRRIE